MTNLTVAEVYAIGLPIIYGMIALEAAFSALTNKSFYRLNDTLCTAGLLIGNILIGSAAKGLSFAIHIFLVANHTFSIAILMIYVVFHLFFTVSHKFSIVIYMFFIAVHMFSIVILMVSFLIYMFSQ